MCDDYISFEPDKLGGEVTQSFFVSLSRTEFYGGVLALDISKLPLKQAMPG